MERKPQENTLSSLSKHPLFSTLITFYTLLIIYLPSLFLKVLFSPVLISAAILLLTLLRLGATQTIQKEFSSNKDRLDQSKTGLCISSENEDSAAFRKTTESSFSKDNGITNTISLESWESGPAYVDAMESTIVAETEMGLGSDHLNDFYAKSFVEWDVRAPLEVIHEEYEGNGDEQNDVVSSIERYASLSLYYPESDSDGSSEDGDFAGMGGWDFPPESRCLWDDEEERGEEDLIEIAFDEKGRSGVVPLEDLIEIDLYPARTPARVEYCNVAGGG